MRNKEKRPRFLAESKGAKNRNDPFFLDISSWVVKRYIRYRFNRSSRAIDGPYIREASLRLDRALVAMETRDE